MKFCLYILYIISISIFELAVSRELKFVQAIWRHGDRAPSKKPYPNDPNDESAWPRGWNQLTNLGIKQMLELGQFFRERYARNFTSPKFNVYEIFVQSSNADRAITSAQAMLNGFFPPIDDQIWEKDARWQPFPIHAEAPADKDPLLKPTSFNCPIYDKLYINNTEKWIDGLKQTYGSLFKFLGNVTGYGNLNFDHILKLSNIRREVAQNMTQPSWVHKIWPEYDFKTTLQLISEIQLESRFKEFETNKLAYLRGGLILGDWLERAKMVVNGTQKDPSKMVLYSSHDGTLLSLTYVLQVNDRQQIPYSAAIIMEIWKNDDGQYEIELFYRKNGALIHLKTPGCDAICPFQKFYDLKKNDAIFDEKVLYQECGLVYCDFGLPLNKPSSASISHLNFFVMLSIVLAYFLS